MAKKSADKPEDSDDPRGNVAKVEAKREARENAVTQEGETPPDNEDVNAVVDGLKGTWES